MMEQYAWFIWSLGFLVPWFGLYMIKPLMRKQMLRVSLWTAPLGLTEPLFVPEYWNPPNLPEETVKFMQEVISCFHK